MKFKGWNLLFSKKSLKSYSSCFTKLNIFIIKIINPIELANKTYVRFRIIVFAAWSVTERYPPKIMVRNKL